MKGSIFIAISSRWLLHTFTLVMNHPFLDGNKRTGFAASLVFLFINGITLDIDEDFCADMVLAVAQGTMKKAQVAESLRDASR